MTGERKKWIQIFLVIALVLSAARLVIIYRSRTAGQRAAEQKRVQEEKAARDFNPTFYVVPKKLYAYDLKTARKLTEQPVWVKEGYRYTYYPFDGRRADFEHEASQLLPIEKLDIKDVVVAPGPTAGDAQQVMAVFEKDGKRYAFSIGARRGADYQLYADEMLFIQDPRELYKQWPAEVWQAIDAHQVKPGMDEVQASFAVGMGIPKKSDDPEMKTVVYPNGGKQVTVTYRNGRAAQVEGG